MHGTLLGVQSGSSWWTRSGRRFSTPSAPAPGPARPPCPAQVLTVLRRNGFAVLEGMVPAAEQLAMEAAAVRHFETLPEGYFTSPLRADRSQVHVPYEDPSWEDT